MAEKSLRQLTAERYSALKSERAPWIGHWQEISRFMWPRAGKFQASDRTRGGDQNTSIRDNTATRAVVVMMSGLMAGATSPARPWFRLAPPDPDMGKFHPVKLWLAECVERMQLVFSESNTYRALPQVYKQLGLFGTGPMVVDLDYETIIHCYPMAAGEYCLATDFRGKANTFFREFELTVAQVVREFGFEKCSQSVQQNYRNGNLQAAVSIVHAIEPRDDRDINAQDNRNMPWRSLYFEWGSNGRSKDKEDVLREGGHRYFPVLAPRWDPECGDVYGGSPAMHALYDTKALQGLTLRHGQAVDFQSKPPIGLPAQMRGKEVDLFPGGVTYIDPNGSSGLPSQQMFRSELRLDHLEFNMAQVRSRIERAFFNDLFLMLANSSDTTQRTAAEIAERHEEKMLMLGPVLENLHNELLKPLIDITFHRMMEVGALPPPPQELQGAELKVEFISALAQAQRAISTNGVDRWVGNLGAIAAFRPEAADKLNVDAWADRYADMLGVPPELVVPNEEVAKNRQARAEAEKAKEQAALLQAHARTARDLAAAPTDTPSALTDAAAAGQFTGYGGV